MFPITPPLDDSERPIKKSLCVDASCRGNPGPMEYQVVNYETGEKIFASPVFPLGTNIVGEFLAIVHALAWMNKNNITDFVIYSDCATAITWIRNKRINTGLADVEKARKTYEYIVRAVNWINNNHYEPRIVLKWKTDLWGENPADYGRK